MKCLKNTKTGNIIRVTDIQAYQMAGSQWKYTSKTEWKSQERPAPKTEETKQLMHEIFHILEHALGLCGDKHPSIIAIISEWHNFSPIFNYIKTIFK